MAVDGVEGVGYDRAHGGRRLWRGGGAGEEDEDEGALGWGSFGVECEYQGVSIFQGAVLCTAL